MIFSQETGIPINEEVMNILKKAIEKDGNRLQFAKKAGVGFTSVGNWLGSNDRKGEFIVWDVWKKIRPHLEALGVISRHDIKWMLPSELREQIKKQDMILTDDERELLYRFRTLNEAGKNAVIASVKAMSETALLSNSESATHKLA